MGMTNAKTPRLLGTAQRQLRRLALLALLPAVLTACMPPKGASDTTTPTATEQTGAMPEGEMPEGAMPEGEMAEGEAAHDMEHMDADHMGAAVSESTGQLPLEASGATVTAVPASLTDTVAYATLRNTSASDIVLVAAASPAAEHAMLMNTISSGAGSASMSGMIEAASLTVPAGGELTLASAGDHVMLMGLKEPLQEGGTVDITLQADDGRTLELSAVVQKP